MTDSFVGKMIREARERRGLTQWDLAHVIGSDQAYVSKIERGAAPASDAILRQWAPELGVSFQRLVLARSGVDSFEVEGDDREVAVRFAGIMPADSVRWTDMQEREETVRVWTSFLRSHAPENCFAVRASGDCLLARGIASGRIVLLRELAPGEQPQNNAIVAVRIGDEYSLKVWSRSPDAITLSDGDGRVVFTSTVETIGELMVLGVYLNSFDEVEGMR